MDGEYAYKLLVAFLLGWITIFVTISVLVASRYPPIHCQYLVNQSPGVYSCSEYPRRISK